MSFDKNGDPPAIYELINWTQKDAQELNFTVVGSFNSSNPPEKQLAIVPQKIVWNGKKEEAGTTPFNAYTLMHNRNGTGASLHCSTLTNI